MQVVETHVQPVADLLLPSQEGSRVPSSPNLACAPNAFPFFRVFRAGLVASKIGIAPQRALAGDALLASLSLLLPLQKGLRLEEQHHSGARIVWFPSF
jgi:hypothetical protein